MATPARGYLDALHALSGDPVFVPARQNLLKGLSDTTLSDIIAECLKINTSRVVREHIIKILLGAITAQQHSQPSGRGYLSALCALSGDADFAAARHDLIEQLSDTTLDDTITEGFGRDIARSSQEQVIEFLLDIIAQQIRSREQEDAATVKEEAEKELPERNTEEVQEQMGPTRDVVKEEFVLDLSEGEVAEQDDVQVIGHSTAMHVNASRKRRSDDAPTRLYKRARSIHNSSTSSQIATANNAVSETDVKKEKEEDIQPIQHILVITQQALPHPSNVVVRLRISDGKLEGREFDLLPTEVQDHLLKRLLDDYAFDSSDYTSLLRILERGGRSKWDLRCINTLLHGRGTSTWCHGKDTAMCDYCVETGRICASLTTFNGKYCLVIHSVAMQLRTATSQTELKYWLQRPQLEAKRAWDIKQAEKALKADETPENSDTIQAKKARRADEAPGPPDTVQAKKAKNAEALEQAWRVYYRKKSSETLERASRAREARMNARDRARDVRVAAEEAEEAERARSARLLRKR